MKQSKAESAPVPRRKHHFNIMIDQVLPRVCQLQLWEAISSIPPSDFLSVQHDIMNILLGDQKLFQSFFKRFYLNHLQLHNWYMLARQNQLQVKKYVFTTLLDKTYRHYRQLIKEEHVKRKFANINEAFRSDGEPTKDRKKECFHKILLGNAKKDKPASCFASLCQEEKERQKEQQFQQTLDEFSREDYHQLFLKTFNACDGSKYIYYDFDKHMRGIDQQKNYNNFIRIKKHTRLFNSLALKDDQLLPKGKENSQSTYITAIPHAYFHEEEEKMEKMVYCNYSWSPIGSVDANTADRQQHILKRLPNVFKKVKPVHPNTKITQSHSNLHHHNSKTFLLRKKKTT